MSKTDPNSPVILNYLIFPHVPKEIGTLLSPEGESVLMDYSKLDWKGLAKDLQAELEAQSLPKTIKVYVGNDAIDLLDMNSVDAQSGLVDSNYNGFSCAMDIFNKAEFKDYRAGVCSTPSAHKGLHLNPPLLNGKRPPVAGFFVSLRFNNIPQMTDYLCSASNAIFGTMDIISMTDENQVSPPGTMPKVMSDWLSATGVVYDSLCTMIRLNAIRK